MNDFTRERIVAIIRLVIMLVSAVAGGFGLTIDPDSLGTIVACGVALAAGVYSWWKNANVTEAATEAQRYLDSIKGGGAQ
ncbi:MAG TPA: SPP1 phage holin family protein [Candidatus Olsenella stercoravium]|uniref:SPP1 phage holin family protein n=1 Tax=Candidatus Olsenella stercoravium TaxID=2838713 RepID=A0A9D2IPI8_9ACTN|nr:SPP1 phage holin family protein [Candidatus Olsenella stercoravium]